VRKGFDDTGVREEGLQRNPFYTHLSSVEFALSVMSLIGVATLLVALFPQGMEETFYLARFGERFFRIYESLGLLSVLRSWWFMLLFALLLVALVFCVHLRVVQRAFKGTKSTALFETEFSIPTSSEEVLLIFPVLLRSIGFRRKGIITDEKRSEITAVKGLSPWITSLLMHVSAAVLLFGFIVSYLFSWGYIARPETEGMAIVPSRFQETRWGRLMGGSDLGESDLDRGVYLKMELLQFRKHYESFPADFALLSPGVPLSKVSMCSEQVFLRQEGASLLLRGWGSSLRLTRGGRDETLYVATGRGRMAFGLSISQGAFSDVADIEFPSVRETLRVTLPAIITRGEVQLNLSPPLFTQLGQKEQAAKSVPAGRPALRVAASSVSGKDERAAEVREETAVLSSGEVADVRGMPVRLLQLSQRSLIRVRYDPGRAFIKLGAVLVVLFCTLRLYAYWYTLRVELADKKGGGSHLKLRMRGSGLLSSPPRVARKIASLLAK